MKNWSCGPLALLLDWTTVAVWTTVEIRTPCVARRYHATLHKPRAPAPATQTLLNFILSPTVSPPNGPGAVATHNACGKFVPHRTGQPLFRKARHCSRSLYGEGPSSGSGLADGRHFTCMQCGRSRRRRFGRRSVEEVAWSGREEVVWEGLCGRGLVSGNGMGIVDSTVERFSKWRDLDDRLVQISFGSCAPCIGQLNVDRARGIYTGRPTSFNLRFLHLRITYARI